MPFTTKRQPVILTAEETHRLKALRDCRSAEQRHTLHAAILLDLAAGMGDTAVAVSSRVNRHTVALCARKFLQFGLDAALGDLPRPGRARKITGDAIAWVLHCACMKPKDVGYPHELWTCTLLQTHVRRHCVEAGYPCLSTLSRSRLHKILKQGEVRPHKIRYYVERRDPEFESKMAEVLHVCKEVEIVNAELLSGALKEPSVVTISHDEKPGIQAIAVTAPDLPPAPNRHRSHLRDYEYIRLGTVSLLAGLDLHSGRVTEIVSEHHASAGFIQFLTKLDQTYPRPNPYPAPARQSLRPYLKGDQSLAGASPQPIPVRLYAQTWVLAEHRGNHVQQNGSQHAARYPRRHQTGTHRPHPPLLRPNQHGPSDLPLEVQNGGDFDRLVKFGCPPLFND